MDDFKSRRPAADDLSFLGDLDRGLEVKPVSSDPGAHAVAPAASPVRPVRKPAPGPAPTRNGERPRPLLAIFPPAAEAAEVVPVSAEARPPAPRPAPSIETPLDSFAPNAADDDLVTEDMFGGPRAHMPHAMADDGDALTDEILGSLREKPFGPAPDLRFLFHSRTHDRAMQALLTAIGQRDACVVLTGDSGTGKTMVCRAVLEQIDHHTFTSFVARPGVTATDLLRAMLTDFGVVSRVDVESRRFDQATEGHLTAALHEFLVSLVQLKGFAVVVIDDAETLDREVLDQVRSLADAHPGLMGVVLAGSRDLLTRFAPATEPGAGGGVGPLRVRLEPLAEDEMRAYVSHRLAADDSGDPRADFDDAALALLYKVSGGVPRVINLVAERALTLGSEQSTAFIGSALIVAALSEFGMVAPDPPLKRFMYDVAVAGGLLGLLLIGAAAGAFVFRTQLRQAIAQWSAPPPAPSGPPIEVVTPLTPPSSGDQPPAAR